MAVGLQAVDTAGWVMAAGLSLIGEVAGAGGIDHEVGQSHPVLAGARRQQRLDLAALLIEQDQAGLVVADEDAAILVDLQAVRPTVILADQVAFAGRRKFEDAAIGNVDEE